MSGTQDINEMIENLENMTHGNSEVFSSIRHISNSTLQVESILKRVYEMSEEQCYNFLISQRDIDLKKLVDTDKTIPNARKNHFSRVTKETLGMHVNYMKGELEMKAIVDTLFEYGVINVRDHDEIQLKSRRKEKTVAFITCVFAKTDREWIPGFLFVLEEKGFKKLAEELSKARPISPMQDLHLTFGTTTTLSARLRVPNETENRLREENSAIVEEAVRAVFGSPLVDLRIGSIYILLNVSKDSFTNAADKLIHLVKEMLQKPKAVESLTARTVLVVELDDLGGDVSNDIYGQDTVFKQVGPSNGTKCSRCRHRTILANFSVILDEIETEIMEQTFQTGDVSNFIRHKCIESIDSVSRTERATSFLQYVLVHEDILQSFWEIFAKTTGINLEAVKCSECSGEATENTDQTILEGQRQYEFEIEKDNEGNISVKLLHHQHGTRTDRVNTDDFYERETKETPRLEGIQDDVDRAKKVLEEENRKKPLNALPKDDDIHRKTLMVAAIDFGTSYSGYAFSTVGSYKSNPLEIIHNQSWNSRGKQLISSKTPTCILLTSEKKFVSFGYDAENEYADILLEGEGDNYIFMDKFKMDLHKIKIISEHMLIEDIHGKTIEAIDVFSLSIKALKDHLMKTVTDKIDIHETEIKWVLTVPTIWSSKAKEFMRKSAEKAGIPSEQLLIALEPEAASIYYQHRKEVEETPTEKDGTYMIVDIGGGTVDISVHAYIEPGKLEELCPPSGGSCGGTTVDAMFVNFLQDIVGNEVMQVFKTKERSSFLDLMREFESVKRLDHMKNKKQRKINITCPLVKLNELCKNYCKSGFSQMIEKSKYKGKVSTVGDKVRIDKNLIESFFTSTTETIVRQIRQVLNSVPRELNTILLVGGFAQSTFVYRDIKAAFPEKNIVSFEDSDLAVLKGAVLFGHKPSIITSRITRYAYGRKIRPRFDPKKHSEEKRTKDGKRCRDVFELLIEKGKSVPIGHTIKVEYHTIHEFQDYISVAFYASKKDNILYVDDPDCELIGEFRITIPNPSKEERKVDVNVTFWRTDLQAEAIDRKTGHKCTAEFQLV